jgi:hypothetical protein
LPPWQRCQKYLLTLLSLTTKVVLTVRALGMLVGTH